MSTRWRFSSSMPAANTLRTNCPLTVVSLAIASTSKRGRIRPMRINSPSSECWISPRSRILKSNSAGTSPLTVTRARPQRFVKACSARPGTSAGLMQPVISSSRSCNGKRATGRHSLWTVPSGEIVATISPDGTVQREWRPVARFPLHDLELDITGCMSPAEVPGRAEQALTNLCGLARVTVSGEVPAELDFNIRDLGEIQHSLEGLLIRMGRIRPRFDVEAIAKETTVRGQFVRNVLAAGMDDEKRQRVLMTGLRALEGKRDLEVF